LQFGCPFVWYAAEDADEVLLALAMDEAQLTFRVAEGGVIGLLADMTTEGICNG
jgi:hypothetical protein